MVLRSKPSDSQSGFVPTMTIATGIERFRTCYTKGEKGTYGHCASQVQQPQQVRRQGPAPGRRQREGLHELRKDQAEPSWDHATGESRWRRSCPQRG